MFANINHKFSILFITFSIFGIIASLILTIDKIQLLSDPDFVAPCTISPYIDCTSVMKSWQASVFGFPNPLFGLIGYSITLTIGVFTYLHNVINKKTLKYIILGTFMALVFSTWLIYQSIYNIGALCPYCLLSFTSATILFAASVAKYFGPKGKELSLVVYSTIGWFSLFIILIYIRYGNLLFVFD